MEYLNASISSSSGLFNKTDTLRETWMECEKFASEKSREKPAQEKLVEILEGIFLKGLKAFAC